MARLIIPPDRRDITFGDRRGLDEGLAYPQ